MSDSTVELKRNGNGHSHTLLPLANDVVQQLQAREEKVVFAESCTAGRVAATLGLVPGVSANLCGSFVVYRMKAKRGWLGIRRGAMKKFTTESPQVASRLAAAALKKTPEADWSVAIVGHLGPDAPQDKDGLLYVCVARRTKKGRVKIKDTSEYRMSTPDRAHRQEEAVEVALTKFSRFMRKRTERESHSDEVGAITNGV
jgi:PncC family amidohydrolase